MQATTADSIFSTDTLPAKDRYAFWQEVVCRCFVPSECRLDREVPLRAKVIAHANGNLPISAVWSSPAEYARTAADIRNDLDHDLLLSLILQGTARLSQDGRTAQLGPKDMVIHDAARPYQLSFDTGYHSLVLKIPRSSLVSRIGQVDQLSARLLPGASPMNRIVRTMLQQAIDEPAFVEADYTQRMNASLMDVLALALEGQLLEHSVSPSSHRALLEEIKQHVIDNLADPGLDTKHLADAFGISQRTLYRLFGEEGETVSRWIWRQRLSLGYQLLAHRRVPNVTAAAFDVGFSDSSHFTRAFKREFGVTPAHVLRSGL